MGATFKEKRILRGLASLLLSALLLPVLVPLALIAYMFLRHRGARPVEPGISTETIPRGRGVKKMDEAAAYLDEVPFGRSLPGPIAGLAAALLEWMPMGLNTARATAGIIYPYPDVFEPVVLDSLDGTPVCGLAAMQEGTSRRPALLLVHGLFSCKNTYGILSIALKAYYEWGFHVFTLDLRNFGDSSRFSGAPTSWGLRESDDILAAAEYMYSTDRVSTVGVYGVSMGASSALLAACKSGTDLPLTGGVVAVNGYADSRRQLELFCSGSGARPVEKAWRLLLKGTLLMKTALGGPRPFVDFIEYSRQVTGQYYEAVEEELFRNSSPAWHIGSVSVPCLVIHSEDDPLVPVSEARALSAAAAGNPMVRSLIVPSGGHALYRFSNRKWYGEVLRRFFTYWSDFGPGPETSVHGLDSIDLLGNPDN